LTEKVEIVSTFLLFFGGGEGGSTLDQNIFVKKFFFLQPQIYNFLLS
jgi:hypothetical protein